MRYLGIDGIDVPVLKCRVGNCPLRGLYSCWHPSFKGEDREVFKDGSWTKRGFPDGCPLREVEEGLD